MIGANNKLFLCLKSALSIIIPCIFWIKSSRKGVDKNKERLIINQLQETFLVKRVSMETLINQKVSNSNRFNYKISLSYNMILLMLNDKVFYVFSSLVIKRFSKESQKRFLSSCFLGLSSCVYARVHARAYAYNSN